MKRDVPIKTVHLFPVLDDLLIGLLRSLSADDWKRPTLARLWTVKDIAAHLLDTNIRAIAAGQQYSGKPPENINSYQDLVAYLNQLNAVWVQAMDRVSPQQLVEMLGSTGKQYCAYIASLDPFADARFSVAWAGEERSANWFHIAREYTEKWHHQQQIREAVGKQGIMGRELFYPCMDTFMRGLPHAYRNVAADNGTLIRISISGEAGGDWFLQKDSSKWQLVTGDPGQHYDAAVTFAPGVAWKLFTKGTDPATAAGQSEIEGDISLANAVFHMIAVMA